MFLKISQSSQENTGVRASFSDKATNFKLFYLKKMLRHRCFAVNFAKWVTSLGKCLFWLSREICC